MLPRNRSVVHLLSALVVIPAVALGLSHPSAGHAITAQTPSLSVCGASVGGACFTDPPLTPAQAATQALKQSVQAQVDAGTLAPGNPARAALGLTPATIYSGSSPSAGAAAFEPNVMGYSGATATQSTTRNRDGGVGGARRDLQGLSGDTWYVVDSCASPLGSCGTGYNYEGDWKSDTNSDIITYGVPLVDLVETCDTQGGTAWLAGPTALPTFRQ